MRAIWQAAVEAPVVLLLAARTGTGHAPGACRDEPAGYRPAE